MKTAFVVQPFELHRKRLRPAWLEQAATESAALKEAENLAKWMPDAAALKVVADDETGELEGVTISRQLGEVQRSLPRASGAVHPLVAAQATQLLVRSQACG